MGFEPTRHHIARFSKPAQRTVSGYLPFPKWTSWESNPSHRSCKDQSPPTAWKPNSDQGGSRTHRHEALDLAAVPICVPGPTTTIDAEAVRLELTSLAATCFRDRILIQPDDFRKINNPVPGVGIEPTNFWFRARRHYQQQLPRKSSTRTRAAQQKTRHPATPGFSSLHEWLSAGVTETNEADGANSPRARRTIDSVAENGRMK